MKIVIAGGSGGIGGAFVENLARRSNVEKITATYNRHPPARSKGSFKGVPFKGVQRGR